MPWTVLQLVNDCVLVTERCHLSFESLCFGIGIMHVFLYCNSESLVERKAHRAKAIDDSL